MPGCVLRGSRLAMHRQGRQGEARVAEAHQQPPLARAHGAALLGVHRQDARALAPQGARGGRPEGRQAQARRQPEARQAQESLCRAR